MSSKVAVSAYNYLPPTYVGVGDVSTAQYTGGTSGTVITTQTGVVTTYVDPVSGNTVQLPGDTKVFHFKDSSGNDRALVAALQWIGQVPKCYYMIFNATIPSPIPSGYNWGTPLYGPVQWTLGSTSLANLYKIQTATISSTFYIYGIDYDAAIAFRLSSSGSTYTLDTTNYFTFAKPSTAGEGHGVDLQIIGSNVYTLFISGTNLSSGAPSASYLNSTVVKTTMNFGSATYKGPHGTVVDPSEDEVWPAKNAFSIQPYGTDLLLTAIGGPQQANTWNPDSHIQKVAQSGLAVTNLLKAAASSSDPVTDQFDFRALTFSADGSHAYILTGKYNTGFTTMNWRLYHTTMSTLTGADNDLINDIIPTTVDNASSTSGYLWALLYSESTVKTWFARGNDLAIYDQSVTGGLVGNAAAIASLTTLGSGAYLNSITIYGGEVAPTPLTLKGYSAPAFASNTAAALLERKRLLEQIAAAKE